MSNTNANANFEMTGILLGQKARLHGIQPSLLF
jgi:hypothetical protein